MSRANIYTTRTGIQIGAHYIPPAPRELGSEAERLQTALLKKRQAGYPWQWWAVVICCGMAGIYFA